MRWPCLLYWPPWHGQPKPVSVASTGQPRCMQRLEKTMNMASLPFQVVPLCPV